MIRNLSYSLSEELLRERLAEEIATVCDVRVLVDRETGRSKGSAVVYIQDRIEAKIFAQIREGRRLASGRLDYWCVTFCLSTPSGTGVQRPSLRPPPPSFRLPAQIANGSTLIVPSMFVPVEDCSICSESLNGLEYIVRTICGHFFHNDCLLKWQIPSRDVYSYSDPLTRRAGGVATFDVSLQNNTCPLCRTPLLPHT